MTAGYLFPPDGWAVAGWVMTPAGPLISTAFALVARARGGPPAGDRKSRVRHIATLLAGMPSPGGNVSALASAAASGLSLLAGAVMVLAGYTAAKWDPLLSAPMVVAGGAVITAAFVVADRGDRSRRPSRGGRAPAGGQSLGGEPVPGPLRRRPRQPGVLHHFGQFLPRDLP